MSKPLLTQLAAAGPPTPHFPEPPDGAAASIPDEQRRAKPPAIGALDEATLAAHFADLATVREPSAAARAAALPAFARCHPAQPASTVQGLLEIAHEVARALAALTGIERFSLQPPTLAAAERAALLIARANFARGEPERRELAVAEGGPEQLAREMGFGVRRVARLPSGDLDVDALLEAVGTETAAVAASWLTPAGAFERNLLAAAEVAHAQGALLCVDATGLDCLAGRTRLGEAGADLCWLSLRELCPQAAGAAVGVRTPLTDLLPSPIIGKARSGFEIDADLSSTIGPLATSPVHVADALAVYVQLLTLGEAGLRARGARLALEANAAAGDSRGTRPLLHST